MIRPMEIQERITPKEYVNRVQKPDKDHSSTTRDFSYEIHEASRDDHKQHQPSPEFGEDKYEPAENPDEPPREEPPEPPNHSADDSNLDIMV